MMTSTTLCLTLALFAGCAFAQSDAAPAPVKEANTTPLPQWTLAIEGKGEQFDFTWHNKVGDSKIYRASFVMTPPAGGPDGLGGPIRTDIDFSAQVSAFEPDGTLVISTTILGSKIDCESDLMKDAMAKNFTFPRGKTAILKLNQNDTYSPTSDSSDESKLSATSMYEPQQFLRCAVLPPATRATVGSSWLCAPMESSRSDLPNISEMNMSATSHLSFLSARNSVALLTMTSATHSFMKFGEAMRVAGMDHEMNSAMTHGSYVLLRQGDALPESSEMTFTAFTIGANNKAFNPRPSNVSINYSLKVISPDDVMTSDATQADSSSKVVQLPSTPNAVAPAPLATKSIATMSRTEAMNAWSERKKYLQANTNASAATRERLESEVDRLKSRMNDGSSAK